MIHTVEVEFENEVTTFDLKKANDECRNASA